MKWFVAALVAALLVAGTAWAGVAPPPVSSATAPLVKSGGTVSCTSADATHAGCVGAASPAVTAATTSAAGYVSVGSQSILGPKTVTGSVTANGLVSSALAGPVHGAFTTADSGGTLLQNTPYCYRVSATNAAGETLATAETCKTTNAAPATNLKTVTPVWGVVPGATGYKVYCRTTGAETLCATIGSGATLSWTDDGSVSPSGALPVRDTSGDATAPNLSFENTLWISYRNSTLSGSAPLGGHKLPAARGFTLAAVACNVSTAAGSATSSMVIRVTDGSVNCDSTVDCTSNDVRAGGAKRYETLSGTCAFAAGSALTASVQTACSTAQPTITNCDFVGTWR